MKYPEDFKQRVKKAYPNNCAIAQALEKGDDEQLKNLLNAEVSKIPIEISKFADYSIEELANAQKVIKEKMDISMEFFRLYGELILYGENG